MNTRKKDTPEAGGDNASSREERLSAALRENLKRRKAQSRQRQDGGAPTGGAGVPAGAEEGSSVPKKDKNSHD